MLINGSVVFNLVSNVNFKSDEIEFKGFALNSPHYDLEKGLYFVSYTKKQHFLNKPLWHIIILTLVDPHTINSNVINFKVTFTFSRLNCFSTFITILHGNILDFGARLLFTTITEHTRGRSCG